MHTDSMHDKSLFFIWKESTTQTGNGHAQIVCMTNLYSLSEKKVQHKSVMVMHR